MEAIKQISIAGVIGLVVGLTGCGGHDSGSGARLEIMVDDSVKPGIRVTEREFMNPGPNNPLDVRVTLENAGAEDRRVLLEGSWKNDAGGQFGGTSDSRMIPGGSTITFAAGTRSKGASRFVLRVSGTTLDADQLAAKTMSEVKPAVPGYGLSYTTTPSLDQIPNWSPKGTANGAPFVAGTILFVPLNGEWEFQIVDREIDPLKGLAFARSTAGNAGLQSIHLNLAEEPRAGKVFEQELGYGGGYFQIQDPSGAAKTTSWNTSITFVLEITQWQRRPYDRGAGTFQNGGLASGSLYVCFKGSEGRIEDSFVAGVFDEAPIVYYGAP